MANYQAMVKRKKKEVTAGGIKSFTAPVRPVAVKAALAKTRPKKVIVTKQYPVRRNVAVTQLVDSMNLDEMLEASKIIDMGMKGENVLSVDSSKAQKYAETILRLNGRDATKSLAEKMVCDLNGRIIKVNKRTTDASESKRLYRKLMAEE